MVLLVLRQFAFCLHFVEYELRIILSFLLAKWRVAMRKSQPHRIYPLMLAELKSAEGQISTD